ncbi:MAG: RNA 3'-phosphate cyclase [Methanobacteriota archaeon]|nr:MAG: RNA 3'-phosphate cyclase [Euryarchaeota archaeon]
MQVLEVDGSIGEGGGQILRTALGLSAVLGKPVRIRNIRRNRPNPGLAPQHLRAAETLAMLVRAETRGLSLGSKELFFSPRQPVEKNFFDVNIGTAGSISLFIQTVAPLSMVIDSEKRLRVVGGTDVRWSPPFDYLRNVFLPAVGGFGVGLFLKLLRRGHYPKGGGLVELTLKPSKNLRTIKIVGKPKVLGVFGVSHCVNLPRHVAERQALVATKKLEEEGYPPRIDVEAANNPMTSPGSGIVLWVATDKGVTIGSSSLGEKGKPAERVGEEAAAKLINLLEAGKPVDPHLADQLIPYMALAPGCSVVETTTLTKHTQTNMVVAEQLTGRRFTSEQCERGFLIRVENNSRIREG